MPVMQGKCSFSAGMGCVQLRNFRGWLTYLTLSISFILFRNWITAVRSTFIQKFGSVWRGEATVFLEGVELCPDFWKSTTLWSWDVMDVRPG